MRICFVLFVAVLAILSMVQADDEKEVCKLQSVTGPCRSIALKYYYNTDAKECKEFYYGGCEGNGNRFDTKEECTQACAE